VQTLWWEGSFDFGERITLDVEGRELGSYLANYVAAHRPPRRARDRLSRLLRRAAARIR
jgi:hypothetical protein